MSTGYASIPATEFERARTWMPEIAEILLSASWRDAGDERTFDGSGGLSINRRTGAWYCPAEGRGGHSPIELIRFVKNWNTVDAAAWVVAFLAAHPGTGTATLNVEDGDGDTAESATRIQCEELLAATVPIDGTAAEAYLSSRGLVPPYPAGLGFVPYARVGEGALIGRLDARGRVVGMQAGYLDPSGRKSLAEPKRRRFNLEKSPGAAFLFPSAVTGPTLLCEGLEDAITLVMLEIGPVIGLPGIGALKHLELPKGTDAVVFRDGDVEGSPAAKALIAGIDHLLLEGATVRVTATPAPVERDGKLVKQDANEILQSAGVDALRQLITDAAPAELSFYGDVQRISKLDGIDYDRERMAVHKRHGARLSTVDDSVRLLRRLAAATPVNAPVADGDPAWDGPPVVLADVLDAALAETGKYVVASETKRGTAVLWSAHTHLVHNDLVKLRISPRLAIQALTYSAGKSTLLRIVSNLSSRGTCRNSVTAATVMRTMEQTKRTLCLDEADHQLADRENKHDLLQILNGGHCRFDSMAERMVPTPDGGWLPVYFNVWGAVAFAGVKELPPGLQERCVRIPMQKATGVEIPGHLRDGTSIELVTIRRQLAAWADSLFELPDPELPPVLMREAGRVGDNWRPLVAIADLAGGRWPALARQAALEEVAAEQQQTELERLLAAILRAFDRPAKTVPADAPDNRNRLRTKTLIGWLLEDTEDDWGVANRGRIITAAWLRERLRGVLNPAGSEQWAAGTEPVRVHCRGYSRLQFKDAWRRYVPGVDAQETSFSEPPLPSATSATSDSSATASDTSPQNSADYRAEAAVADAYADESIRHSNDDQKSQDFRQSASSAVADESDVADVADGNGGGKNIKTPAEGGTDMAPAPTTNGSADEQPEDDEGAAERGAHALADMVVEARAAYPTRSLEWLAKHLGMPLDTLRAVLDGGAA